MITVAAHAAAGAATSVVPPITASVCSAMYAAPPVTTTLAKNPSGSKRTSRARRLAMNQRYANAAAVSSVVFARSCWRPSSSAGRASATYAYPRAGSFARVTRRRYNIEQ